MFNLQIPLVMSDDHVVIWDARGHGKSQPFRKNLTMAHYIGDLVFILDQVVLDKVTQVEQSVGGYFAQYYYLTFPN